METRDPSVSQTASVTSEHTELFTQKLLRSRLPNFTVSLSPHLVGGRKPPGGASEPLFSNFFKSLSQAKLCCETRLLCVTPVSRQGVPLGTVFHIHNENKQTNKVSVPTNSGRESVINHWKTAFNPLQLLLKKPWNRHRSQLLKEPEPEHSSECEEPT